MRWDSWLKPKRKRVLIFSVIIINLTIFLRQYFRSMRRREGRGDRDHAGGPAVRMSYCCARSLARAADCDASHAPPPILVENSVVCIATHQTPPPEMGLATPNFRGYIHHPPPPCDSSLEFFIQRVSELDSVPPEDCLVSHGLT